MKFFIYAILFFLYACESVNVPKDIKKNKKEQNIKMEINSEPSIKIKK